MDYNVAKIRDKLRNYEKYGDVVVTNFLTPAEIEQALEILRGHVFCVSGGFDEAERRVIEIGTSEDMIMQFCTVIRIKACNCELSHRAVLGSILGLGIKREMIGDIILADNVCDVIIMNEMKEFVLNNLVKVGREKVVVSEVSFDELLKADSNAHTQNISVASLRIDAIMSSALGISREKSSLLINQEKVLINFLPCKNVSKSVKEGDLISVRGFGRIKLLEVLGETRKGRVRVLVCLW